MSKMNKIKQITIKKINNELNEEVLDTVIEEIPLNIFVNYKFLAALMCTPSELKELAVGFLFSEELISSYDCIKSIEEEFEGRVCVVLNNDINLDDNNTKALTSGCAKGSIHLKFVDGIDLRPIEGNCKFEGKNILALMREFNSKSELFKQTGGVHSCAICSNDSVAAFSEDIGRHNALDKVLGKALLSSMELKDKLVMTTGRISSDMVIKAVKAGIPVIASHSAPTALALALAEAAGITVIGFVRGNRMNIYCGEARII